MSRSKAAAKFVVSSFVVQILIVVSGLIVPPLMIKEYGSEVNGIVNTIKQLITYFSIVSLGLGITAQVALYKPLSDNNWYKINEILSATSRFFNRTGFVFLGIIIISSLLFPLVSKTDTSNHVLFLLVLIYGIGAMSEFIFISKYKILLAADQKQHILSNIQSQGILINTFVSVVLILCHSSILLVQLMATLTYLLRLLLTIRYVKKKYVALDFNVTPNNESLNGKWTAFSYQIAGMINTYTPIIIVAFFCGFKNASVFSIYNMIFFSLTMITAIFSSGFSASFGNMLAKNEVYVLAKSFASFEFMFRNIMFVVYTIALILVIPFMSIYIKSNDGVTYVLPYLAIAFVLHGIIKGMRIPFLTLVEAAGMFKQNNLLNIAEALLNVAISLALVNSFGLMGVLIGGIISAILRSLLFVFFAQKHILCNIDYKYYLNFLLNLILVFALYYFFYGAKIQSVLEFIVLGIKVAFTVLSTFILLNVLTDFSLLQETTFRIKNILTK
jgi:O-antigen/teichoic acid export membrane protein